MQFRFLVPFLFIFAVSANANTTETISFDGTAPQHSQKIRLNLQKKSSREVKETVEYSCTKNACETSEAEVCTDYPARETCAQVCEGQLGPCRQECTHEDARRECGNSTISTCHPVASTCSREEYDHTSHTTNVENTSIEIAFVAIGKGSNSRKSDSISFEIYGVRAALGISLKNGKSDRAYFVIQDEIVNDSTTRTDQGEHDSLETHLTQRKVTIGYGDLAELQSLLKIKAVITGFSKRVVTAEIPNLGAFRDFFNFQFQAETKGGSGWSPLWNPATFIELKNSAPRPGSKTGLESISLSLKNWDLGRKNRFKGYLTPRIRSLNPELKGMFSQAKRKKFKEKRG